MLLLLLLLLFQCGLHNIAIGQRIGHVGLVLQSLFIGRQRVFQFALAGQSIATVVVGIRAVSLRKVFRGGGKISLSIGGACAQLRILGQLARRGWVLDLQGLPRALIVALPKRGKVEGRCRWRRQ